MHFIRGGPGRLSFCFCYYTPLFYSPIFQGCEISFILQLRKGFWETFTEWEEEEEQLDPEEEDKRRRKEMEEEGIALMGRLDNKQMVMNINKHDGNISAQGGRSCAKLGLGRKS